MGVAIKLLQFRFANFTAFMLDLYAAAARLSCAMQSNSLTIFDVAKHVSNTMARLSTLKGTASENEAAFLADCAKDMAADVFKATCHLEEGEEGRMAVAKDRVAACDALSQHLQSRFTSVLDKPELHAFAVFDHRKWPALTPKEPLELFGKPEISYVAL